MTESFGPEYVRPVQKDCPRCGCCSERLCEKGRNSMARCAGHATDEVRSIVDGCPCSAATTKRTAAWRIAQIRATKRAKAMPLAAGPLSLLRLMSRESVTEAPGPLIDDLKVHGFTQIVYGLPAITPLGRTYLAALDDVRAPTSVRVIDVDSKTRLARVEVATWRPDEPVTVLLDQIISDAVVTPDELPGRWLEAEANCHAEDIDRLVLVDFRLAAPLPEGWMGGAE